MSDMVHHPAHYSNSRFGVECIEFTRLMPFCTGNAFKYVFRCESKGNTVQDLEKARVYAYWAKENFESSTLPSRRREIQALYFRHLHPFVGPDDWQARILGHIVFEEWDEAVILIDRWIVLAKESV